MKWEPHYMGIETGHLFNVNKRRVFCNLYLQRDRNSKRMQFVRLSLGYRGADDMCKRSIMLGAFLGRVSYLPGWRGIELFSDRFRIGYCEPWADMRWIETKWSGSRVNPWHAFAFRIGRLGLGFNAPAWLQRWKERKEQRIFETWAENHQDDWCGGPCFEENEQCECDTPANAATQLNAK